VLKIVSIVHPALGASITEAVAETAFEAGEFEAYRVVPVGRDTGTHTRVLPFRGGRGRFSRYRGLRKVLREIQPDVLHVQADPCGLLALQVALLRRRYHRCAALVVECDHAAAVTPFWPFSRIRRRVLAHADAAIARHSARLRLLAAAGFEGAGFTIAPGIAQRLGAKPDRAAARAALGLPETGTLVVGFASPLVEGYGIIDVLEGVAACRSPVVLIVAGDGALRNEILDRAASLGAMDRIRVLDPGQRTGNADVMAALDALVIMPRARFAARAAFDRSIAVAQSGGLPVIVSQVAGLGEMAGAGGWLVEPGDPGLLAGLLNRLAQTPLEVARVTEATKREAANRYSEDAIRDGLRRAFDVAFAACRKQTPQDTRLGTAIAQMRGDV
jgi:glycosyltransferase involved in cell wall biosynthesis